MATIDDYIRMQTGIPAAHAHMGLMSQILKNYGAAAAITRNYPWETVHKVMQQLRNIPDISKSAVELSQQIFEYNRTVATSREAYQQSFERLMTVASEFSLETRNELTTVTLDQLKDALSVQQEELPELSKELEQDIDNIFPLFKGRTRAEKLTAIGLLLAALTFVSSFAFEVVNFNQTNENTERIQRLERIESQTQTISSTNMNISAASDTQNAE